MPLVNDLPARLAVLDQLDVEQIESLRPFHDYVLIRRTPRTERTAGGLFIPHVAQEEPLEGVVVAVGPGRTYPDRYCGVCGQLAGWTGHREGVRVYACKDHLETDDRRLLKHRPVGVERGARVVFSAFAAVRQIRRIRTADGRVIEYVLTDDVLGACEPGCGLVEAP